MRKLLSAAIVGVMTLIVFVVAEGGFRLLTAYPTTSNATYEADTGTIYRHKPNSSGWEVSPVDEFPPAFSQYNNWGFRGPDFPQRKPVGEIRIAVLGDSIVEGRQTNYLNTMTSRLETMLGQDTGKSIRVINAGVSAFTTTTANLLLKRYVIDVSPDIVIYVFFANDYADNYVYGNYSQYDGILEGVVPERLVPDMSGPNWRDQPMNWLRRHSALVHYAMSFGDREATANSLKNIDAVQGTSDDFRESAKNINKLPLSDAEKKILDFTHQGLEAMSITCRDLGIPFVIAVMPFPPQVSANEWKTGKQRYGFGPDDVMGETIYQERLAAFGREHSIPVIDLLPAFRNATNSNHNFLNYDGHLTASGHNIAATVLAQSVSEIIKHR